MTRVQAYVAIAMAGALGALARDALDRVITARIADGRLPAGILIVNVLGSLGLGLLAGAEGLPPEVLVVGGLGFLGAFTTFSTFAVQAVRLPRRQAVRYVALTVAACAGAAAVGLWR